MNTVEFSLVGAPAWDAVHADSPDAWFFHRHDWVEIEQRFFTDRNLSFAITEGSRTLAIQPLYLTTCGLGDWTETLIHSGLHRHTGLAMAAGLDEGRVAAVRAVAMRRIEELAELHDVDRIQLNAQNLAPAARAGRRDEIPYWVTDHGYHLGLNFGPMGILPAPGMSTCCADQIVELASDEEAMFAGLDPACRRAVRKAIASDITFSEGSGEVAIDEYLRLARDSALRTGEALAPDVYFRHLWGACSPNGSCALLFARHGDKTVAGLLLAVDKGAASYLGGVSLSDYLPSRVNDFIHWMAMVWGRRNGLACYRLGPTFPELPVDWPIVRVARFKAKFGGLGRPVLQGSRFRRPGRYLAGACRHLAALCGER